MAEKLDVTIKTNPPGAPTCIAEHFIAGRGKTVIFKFPEFPNADLIFPNGSPFEKDWQTKALPPRPHTPFAIYVECCSGAATAVTWR